MTITKSIKYIGVNDREIDLFEGQYVVPNGMAYNSYLITDDKIAVMDTVDIRFADEWLDHLSSELNGRTPDYLIVQHMEPDHSSSILRFTEQYPDAKIVSSRVAFGMMKNFFGTAFDEKQLVISEGSALSLGMHELTFVSAPMVHWPEVMLTYDKTDKVLFSADAFGKFGALDADEDWACEARRYYFGIVGKYGVQVQNLLKKLVGVEVNAICPLHGPILSENLEYYLGLYDKWSRYEPENKGVVIAYTSVYGNTKKAALQLAEILKENGCPKVAVHDLARGDMAEALEDAFRYDTLVLATTTYNTGIFPFMHTFLNHLAEHNFQNRRVALIENGSWAPTAAGIMREHLEKCKNITFCDTTVKILSTPNAETENVLEQLAKELWAQKTV